MDFKVNNMLKTYGINKPVSSSYKTKTQEKKENTSALEVSKSVIEYNSALETVKGTSDVREDIVAKYKGLIDSGNYSVSVNDLADKMLDI